MFNRVNLRTALLDQRERTGEDILQRVMSFLNREESKYASIESRLDVKGPLTFGNDQVDTPGELFELEDIRKVCVRYGLRFLDSKLYCGELPIKALQRIKTREDAGNAYLGFKIMAPAEVFQLEDENADPLLFGELADGRYELLAKWGQDLSAFRLLKNYPRRNFLTLFISFALLISLINVVTPASLLTQPSSGFDAAHVRMIYLYFISVGLAAITGYCWFSFNNRFATQVWNSQTF